MTPPPRVDRPEKPLHDNETGAYRICVCGHSAGVHAEASPSCRVKFCGCKSFRARPGLPLPDGHAYQYHDYLGDVIRFNGGEEVNGNKPFASIPFYFAHTVAQHISAAEGTSSSAQLGTDRRERFELWWKTRYPLSLAKRTSKSGAYDNGAMNDAWLAWNAAEQERNAIRLKWESTKKLAIKTAQEGRAAISAAEQAAYERAAQACIEGDASWNVHHAAERIRALSGGTSALELERLEAKLEGMTEASVRDEWCEEARHNECLCQKRAIAKVAARIAALKGGKP